MKIKLDDEEIYKLEEWEKKLFLHDIPRESWEEDIKRRLEWVLRHKCQQCYKRMVEEWLPILQADPEVKSIPADKQALVEMIIARPDYKDRSARDKEDKAALQGQL